MKNMLGRHLRTPVLAAWITVFLGLLGVATWVNGGFGFVRARPSGFIVAFALLGSAMFSLCLLYLSRVQGWALRPGSSVSDILGELRVIALLAGSLGLGLAVDLCLKALDA